MEHVQERSIRPFHNLAIATGLVAMSLSGCEQNSQASPPTPETTTSPIAAPVEIIDIHSPKPTSKPEDPTISLQRNLNNQLVHLGMPKLELDGKEGPQVNRAECAVRFFTGHKASRKDATRAEMRAWAHKQPLRTPLTGFVISKTCQVMGVNLDGELKMIIPVSTGLPSSPTPSDSYRLYSSLEGWHNSSSHPDKSWRKANMFYPLYFSGGYAIHGSHYMSVSGTTPRSSGCVRVSLAVAPKLYELAHDAPNARLKHIPVHVLA